MDLLMYFGCDLYQQHSKSVFMCVCVCVLWRGWGEPEITCCNQTALLVFRQRVCDCE